MAQLMSEFPLIEEKNEFKRKVKKPLYSTQKSKEVFQGNTRQELIFEVFEIKINTRHNFQYQYKTKKP